MKKYKKDAYDMVKTGAVLGVGSHVLGQVPNTASAQTAMSNMSGFLPIVGTLKGAEHTMKALKKLK